MDNTRVARLLVRAKESALGYSCARDSGLVREAGILTMRAKELLKARREEIMRIAARYGARNVRVFGSVARGDADEASDIDFLVEMEPGRSLFDLGGLQVELEALLGCRVDVVSEKGLKARIRGRVFSEAVRV